MGGSVVKILVVDRNEAFATMLGQMLETNGDYEVEVAHRGSDALHLLRQSQFDLTIIDVDLDRKDIGYRDLILSMRQLEPTMRLMVIPMLGEELPLDTLQLDIQGTLSKPFFADDLLPSVEEALAKQVAPPAVRPTAPPSVSRLTEAAVPDLQAILSELAREINAEATVLLSMISGDHQVIAHLSTLSRADLELLADLGVGAVRSAQAAARLLGQPDRPYEHNMFESKTHRLYVMTLSDGRLLMVVTPISTPLGTIRHNLRRTVRHLTEMALT
jgi:CheY-like chemotaxis protein/predicted regulator of Ras-like GTPase activity (Roadblock/LC7/MglB family)